MTKREAIEGLLIVGISVGSWLWGHESGKRAAYKEIKEHPFACVPGQMVDLPSGRYFCAERIEWKTDKSLSEALTIPQGQQERYTQVTHLPRKCEPKEKVYLTQEAIGIYVCGPKDTWNLEPPSLSR